MTTSLEKVGRILLFVIISKSRAIDPSSTKPNVSRRSPDDWRRDRCIRSIWPVWQGHLASGNEVSAARSPYSAIESFSFRFPFRLWRFEPRAISVVWELDAGLFERGGDLLPGFGPAA